MNSVITVGDEQALEALQSLDKCKSQTESSGEKNGTSLSQSDELDESHVNTLIRTKKWRSVDKKKFLNVYGFDNWQKLCLFHKEHLAHTERAYHSILKALYVEQGIKDRKSLRLLTEDPNPEMSSSRYLEIDGQKVMFSSLFSLALPNGVEGCIALSNIVAPVEDTSERIQRDQEIRNVFETQLLTKLKDGKQEVKCQYFPYMKEYLNWILYSYELLDSDGNKITILPPFSKHLHGVEFIKMKLDASANSGKAYSGSTIKRCVQGINTIWEREVKMYPDKVTWKRPGETKVFKELIRRAVNRKVQTEVDNYCDRGIKSHLEQLKMEDLARLDEFVLSYHPSFRESYEAEDYRDMGLPITNDSESERMKQLKMDLKSFRTYYDLLCFKSMHSACTNTYIRGQQTRAFQLADVSTMSCPAMGSTTFPGFHPCQLVVFRVNQQKNQPGDKVEWTYLSRHKNVKECAVKDLAFHIVVSFSSINGENARRGLPDFSENKNWYDEMLFPMDLKDPKRMFVYKDQAEEVNRMNRILGIQTCSVVHATRHFMDMNDAPIQDISRLALYKSGMGIMEKVYIKAPPVRAIRARTGFAWQGTEWFIVRQALWIEDLSNSSEWKISQDNEFNLVRQVEKAIKNGPSSYRKVFTTETRPNFYLLVLEIFPFLQDWKKVFDLSWIKQHPEKTYLAAQGFVEFVEYMAIVFLQDAVFLRDEYSDFYLYRHEVFKHPLWEEFSAELKKIENLTVTTNACKAVSQDHRPEVQAELERVYKLLGEQKQELLEAKTNQLKLQNQNQQLAKSIADMKLEAASTSNKLIEATNVVQRQLATLVRRQQTTSKTPTSPNGSKNLKSVQNSSPKSVSPIQISVSRNKLTPGEKKQAVVKNLEYDLDQARRDAFNASKPFKIPEMKAIPRRVYEAYYKDKFGKFTGLLAIEQEAQLLNIPWKNALKTQTVAELEEKTGKKSDVTNLARRYRQLKRVANLYKSVYDEVVPRVKIPREQALNPSAYVHGEATKAFRKKALLTGGLKADWQCGDSLQALCNTLQQLESAKNGTQNKRGRRKKVNTNSEDSKSTTNSNNCVSSVFQPNAGNSSSTADSKQQGPPAKRRRKEEKCSTGSKGKVLQECQNDQHRNAV